MTIGTTLPFFKYHGTGNDFIIIDTRGICWIPLPGQIARMCDRHSGIGADGLMLVTDSAGSDFGMTYFNSDGMESTMCGNGGRCIAAFAKQAGQTAGRFFFNAIDGRHEAEIISENGNEVMVRLKMKDTKVGQVYADGIFVDTGSPHFVTFTDHLLKKDILRPGRELRFDPRFSPGGTNVDFAELKGRSLFVRTYERGVEAETLSCGTGVTASAMAAAFIGQNTYNSYDVTTQGGLLKVSFTRSERNFSNVWLEGPATFVFDGKISLTE